MLQALTIIVFQRDPRLQRWLSVPPSAFITTPSTLPILSRNCAWTLRVIAPEVAVLDVEAASLMEVARLHCEYPGLSIVCTHRVADGRKRGRPRSPPEPATCALRSTHRDCYVGRA